MSSITPAGAAVDGSRQRLTTPLPAAARAHLWDGSCPLPLAEVASLRYVDADPRVSSGSQAIGRSDRTRRSRRRPTQHTLRQLTDPRAFARLARGEGVSAELRPAGPARRHFFALRSWARRGGSSSPADRIKIGLAMISTTGTARLRRFDADPALRVDSSDPGHQAQGRWSANSSGLRDQGPNRRPSGAGCDA